jgi:hypothetical protein
MGREKVFRTVHGVWKEEGRGILHDELVKKLDAHKIPTGTVQALIDEGAIKRFKVANHVIYLPNQGYIGTSTGSYHPVSVVVGEGPQDVTESSVIGRFSITPGISAESKEYLSWYQRAYKSSIGGVSRLIGGFRKEIREIFKHYRADAS